MASDSTTLKRKTRIVAATDLPGVPEGTEGKVGRAVGLDLVRYRVAFDNGVKMNSVVHTKLVPADEWDDYLANREREAEAAAERAANADAAPADAPADAGAGGDGGAPVDDRMAALLARSKAARERKASAG